MQSSSYSKSVCQLVYTNFVSLLVIKLAKRSHERFSLIGPRISNAVKNIEVDITGYNSRQQGGATTNHLSFESPSLYLSNVMQMNIIKAVVLEINATKVGARDKKIPSYIARITNSEKESEMEANLEQVGHLLGNLTHMATDMRRKIDSGNEKLDILIPKVAAVTGKIKHYTKRAEKLMK